MKKFISALVASVMLIATCIPMAFAEGEPAFPANTELTVNAASGRQISVTHLNSALLADGATVVPAYKVEILAENGNLLYSNIFETEAAIAGKTTATVLRKINLYANAGSFTAKVYPMSAVDETALIGEPIVKDFTVGQRYLNKGTVRYELEDYNTKYPNLNETVAYASGGKLFNSHNGYDNQGVGGNWYTAPVYQLKEEDVSLSFEIDLPLTGTYTVDTAMTKVTSSLSTLEVYVDGKLIHSNANTSYNNISMSAGTYPWRYEPMFIYRSTGVSLTAGKHTLNFKVIAPTSNTSHIFAADYIQFVPELLTIENAGDTYLEYEDYAAKLSTATKEQTSPNTSGGKYVIYDTTDVTYVEGETTYDPITLDVPIYVESAGCYTLEHAISGAGSTVSLFIDDNETKLITLSPGTKIDATDPVSSEYTYFATKYHPGTKRTAKNVFLPAGSHTLKFALNPRIYGGNKMDIAIALDYLKFTPQAPAASIPATGTTIELENYVSSISSAGAAFTGATVLNNAITQEHASNGQLLDMQEKRSITDAKVYIPVYAEKAGWYDVEWTISNANDGSYIGIVTLNADGEPIVTNEGKNVVEDLTIHGTNEEGKNVIIYPALNYTLAKYQAQVYLSEGLHNIDMSAVTATKQTGIFFVADYLKFTPVSDVATNNSEAKTVDVTAYYDAPVSGTVITALYNGKELVGVSSVQADGITKHTAAVSYSAAPDTAKVFVWTDTNDIIPLTINKVIGLN